MTKYPGPASDQEWGLRRTIRGSLEEWARYVLHGAGQTPARHHVLMIAALEALERGETKRLMLLMPPGSAKSTYATMLFPAWWMARAPATSILTACNTTSLAEHFGRRVRGLLTEHGARLDMQLRADAHAAGRFLTDRGGEYFAIGVNGSITGRRADLVLIDDPIRSALEASSAAARDRLWEWYRCELITRLKPDGKLVLVTTRWHPDDMAGRLIQLADWKRIRVPALAEDGDALGRLPGEALWPSWEDRDALLAKRATLGERRFGALFQQAPQADEGGLFNLARLGFVDAVPDGTSVRAWDLAGVAGPAGDPDWTVGVKLLRDQHGGYVVQDVRRVRAGPAEVAALICEVARQDSIAVAIGLPCDPGQAGMYQVGMLTRLLAGFRVSSSREVGSKLIRAEPVAGQIESGNLSLSRGQWNDAFLDELSTFPHGKKDDQVDAFSRAFSMLAPDRVTLHFTRLPFIGR